jgi:hypothetical protein
MTEEVPPSVFLSELSAMGWFYRDSQEPFPNRKNGGLNQEKKTPWERSETQEAPSGVAQRDIVSQYH